MHVFDGNSGLLAQLLKEAIESHKRHAADAGDARPGDRSYHRGFYDALGRVLEMVERNELPESASQSGLV